MLQRLTNSELIEVAMHKITGLLRQYAEWFLSYGPTFTHSVRRDEIEIAVLEQRLLLSCWTEKGNQTWRILSWDWTGQSLVLQISRKVRTDQPLIELVPRASALAVATTVRTAREIRCEKIARLAEDVFADAKLERFSLSPGIRRGQPGKYARIILRERQRRIAVTASVVALQHSSVDAFLSSAILWFKRAAEFSEAPVVDELWLIVSEPVLRTLFYRVSLLRDGLRKIIRIFVIDNELTRLDERSCPTREELWHKRLSRFPPVPAATMTKLTSLLAKEAPEAIDVVYARNGQTLRYFGLPFARIRSLLGEERAWFGLDGAHRVLLERETFADWEQLLSELREYRSASALDHRHAFYRNASEAWLESLLRKDITKLDPGLIIAPLHAQFRTTHGGKLGIRPIDMLALRQDGRLVVIELKVSEDREHVLQGADYWRRVEAHRRRGHIAKAKLFGDRKLSDESPLVYLVAPTLRVHPAFETLAQCIDREIEIYRFDINEDWRSGVRVMRRVRMN
jgi:hypothetical protein